MDMNLNRIFSSVVCLSLVVLLFFMVFMFVASVEAGKLGSFEKEATGKKDKEEKDAKKQILKRPEENEEVDG